MNVSASIVKMLESIGLEALFTGSGQGSGNLLMALSQSKKIRTIMVRHEQAASFMACGYAMFKSGNLGVCSAQGGPGSFNLFSGLGVALSASLPVLSIASYCPQKWQGMGDLGEVTGKGGTPDSQVMFGATTKKTFLINHPGEVSTVVEEAVHTAFEGRPGPVHIDLPYDIDAMPASNHREIALQIPSMKPLPETVDLFAKILGDALNSEKNILVLIGFGAVRSQAGFSLKQFCQDFQIPFVTTMDAKGIIQEDHPLSLGMVGICGDPGAKQALKEAHVVLALGNSFAKWQMWKFEENIFQEKTLLHINIHGEEIGRVYPTHYGMVADVHQALMDLHRALTHKSPLVVEKNLNKDKLYGQRISGQGEKIHPAALCRELSALLPPRAILLGEAGSSMIWLASQVEMNQGQTFKNPGSFGPMAVHVNGAMGVQLANPDRPVIVGCGDGSYALAGFDLLTAVQYQIPIIWIIFNNSEFNIIKNFNYMAHGRKAFTDLLNPDFSQYAQLCGACGFRVEKLEDFSAAFQSALSSKRPSVIDVIVDPEPAIPFAPYDKS